MERLYSTAELRRMVRDLVVSCADKTLDLQTITAKETVKGKEVVLEFRFGIDGEEW